MNHIRHLIHVIEEAEGIRLSEKSKRDISETISGACREATKGSIANMKEWKSKYYELKRGD